MLNIPPDAYARLFDSERRLIDALETVFLTPADVSRHLRVKVESLRQLRYAGRGPRFYKLENGTIRYAVADVLRYQLAARSK